MIKDYRKERIRYLYISFVRMLLLLLGLLLFGIIIGTNFFLLLLRILLFFLLLSVTWFLIKGGFYILLVFAVVYAGIKGISYLRNYVKGNKSEYVGNKKVEFNDTDFVEIVE